ncbi:MAG: NosD domain-containing protein [Candidatus Bathyarchaeia archaeon]|jgi:parallel beta-helix repeat protein
MTLKKSLKSRIRGWLPEEPQLHRNVSSTKLRPQIAVLLTVSLVVASSVGGYLVYRELLPVVPNPQASSRVTQDIYIFPEGVSPASASNLLSKNGDVYTFTENISDPVYVDSNNTVLNGAGYSLLGFRVQVDGGQNNVTVENLKVYQGGIDLQGSNYDTVCGNYIVGDVGVLVRGSYNSVTNNSIVSTSDGGNTGQKLPLSGGDSLNCGIEMDALPVFDQQHATNYNNVTGNQVCNFQNGILLWNASENFVANNYFANNAEGITLQQGTGNTFVGNTVQGSLYAVTPNQASNNTFFGNSFVDNKNQIVDAQTYSSIKVQASVNIWDNGTIGNYWSNYHELYPKAQEISSSGVEDTPYQIYANNTDQYPLSAASGNMGADG